MKIIVDVQGFKNDQNYFLPKEIAIVYNDRVQVLLIRPPYPYEWLTETEKKQVNWIEKNRKITWSEGFVPYENYKCHLIHALKCNDIYCKGLEKQLWLKDILNNPNVFNLEDKGCPSLLTLYKLYDSHSDIFSCVYHPTICALKNVTCLRKWCLNNKIIDN